MSLVLDLIRNRSRDCCLQTDEAAMQPPAVLVQAGTSAVVFDSPHSGTCYPADFRHVCDPVGLRRAEDTHVEKLFDFAPALGIAWVEATFPRSYVDANRSEHEIDPDMVEGEWPHPLPVDPECLRKVRLGKGLIWKLTDEGRPLYDRRLTVAEVEQRIRRCWQPYHAALQQLIEQAHARHGRVIHLNCHSMPSVAASHATEHPGVHHPDFVLGDRDGSTASGELATRLAAFLRSSGYSVAVNHPYKGVELVRRYSDPLRGRHSLQLEINRQLYMDETRLTLHAGAEPLKRDLRRMAESVLGWSREDAFGPGAPTTDR